MTIARHYVMLAAEAQTAALKVALTDLGSKISPLAGCEGVEIMQDLDEQSRFVFVERWTSMEAYRAAGRMLGKAAFAPISLRVVSPPEACCLEVIEG